MKMRSPQYRAGDHLRVCDRCGFTIYHSESKKEWTGAIVCAPCWDPRHPQDLVRAKADNQAVKDARPYPDTYFLSTNEVTRGSL